MRHNILVACFDTLGLQGPRFIEELINGLDELTDTHSEAIVQRIDQL